MLDGIEKWTTEQKMLINEKKTKNLIFNFTEKYQFSTRLKLNNEIIEILDSTKLLGTIISNDLRWDLNTKNIVKKANARMELLRRVASFGTPVNCRFLLAEELYRIPCLDRRRESLYVSTKYL